MNEFLQVLRDIHPFIQDNLTAIVIGGIFIIGAIKFSLDNTK